MRVVRARTAELLDLAEGLTLPEEPPASRAAAGEDVHPRRPIENVAKALAAARSKLEKLKTWKGLITKLLAGEPLAGQGGRDIAIQRAASSVAFVEPDLDPDILAEAFFAESIKAMTDEAPDPEGNPPPDLDDVAAKIARSQVGMRRKRAEAEDGDRLEAEERAREAREFAQTPPRTNGVNGANGVHAHGPDAAGGDGGGGGEGGGGDGDGGGGGEGGDGKDEAPPQYTRKTQYTDEEMARWAQDLGVTAAQLNKQLVVQSKGKYWLFWEGKYLPAVGKDDVDTKSKQTLAPVRGYSIYRKEGNKIIRKKRQDVLDDVSVVAMRCVADLCASYTYFDRATSTLRESVGRIRPIVPKYDAEVDFWMRLIVASDVERGMDWIATAPCLDQESAALYIEGIPSSGKQLLAHCLARLWWEHAPTKVNLELSRWTHKIADCPILWVDEELERPWTLSSLRDIISARTHQLSMRYTHAVELHGAIRLFCTANNSRILSLDDQDYGDHDVQAIASRFIHVRPSPETPAYLAARGNASDWVDRAAAHILWLRDNRPVVRGVRFLVPGQGESLARQLVLSQPVSSACCEFIVRYLCDRGDKIVVEHQRGVLVDGHEVLASTEGLSAGWKALVKSDMRQPSTTRIGHALRQISTGERWIGEGAERRLYRVIRPFYLEAWAEQAGVGDVEQLRAICGLTV